ncbi:hypothetical protein KFK09_013494 [Dendrobium nobile]|uniref:Uncharacterized protein n=1 Tax=Dendrobium nobile TaxID=94219 RepID=A0A8T3B988_DENNO|nr:hypothetical protein KFK09_013494 [Dendrobium nobile]
MVTFATSELPPVVVGTSDPTKERRAVLNSDPTGRNVVEVGEQVFYRLVQNFTSRAKQAKSNRYVVRTARRRKANPKPSATARQSTLNRRLLHRQ